jgi:GTPase SAR1 family protein
MLTMVINVTIYRVQELNEKASASIVITIIGNKIDLEQRQVSEEEA